MVYLDSVVIEIEVIKKMKIVWWKVVGFVKIVWTIYFGRIIIATSSQMFPTWLEALACQNNKLLITSIKHKIQKWACLPSNMG